MAGKNKNLITSELKAVYSWIVLNYDSLITIWNSTDLDSGDIVSLLKQLP